jgi:CelD/BcsL family acetyltransferase involved in cellulose biosynthesis
MSKLQIKVVRDFASLVELGWDWRELHRADPQGTVFTSWQWMFGLFSALAEPWRVLIALYPQGDSLIGLLPLRGDTVVAMAGSPLADYTGFLCLPGHERAVLAAFAAHLKQDPAWSRLELRDVFDPRLPDFLAFFPKRKFAIVRHPPTPCPLLQLEETWDGYLAARMGAGRRQSLRRQLREIEKLPGLRFTSLADGAEAQFAVMLELWQSRWGKRPESELAELKAVFTTCSIAGHVWLDILWRGEDPLAGLLAFLDHGRSRFCFYISGYDRRFADHSPGTVMVAHSIRRAIGMGFRHYDFLRGDEAYKYSFGARLAEIDNVDVVRPT